MAALWLVCRWYGSRISAPHRLWKTRGRREVWTCAVPPRPPKTFMCHTYRSEKWVELGLWRKEGREDVHSWPLEETLHWPIKKWKIFPPANLRQWFCVGASQLWPFSTFLPVKFLNVSWIVGDQLALWQYTTLKVTDPAPVNTRNQVNPMDFRDVMGAVVDACWQAPEATTSTFLWMVTGWKTCQSTTQTPTQCKKFLLNKV